MSEYYQGEFPESCHICGSDIVQEAFVELVYGTEAMKLCPFCYRLIEKHGSESPEWTARRYERDYGTVQSFVEVE